MKNIALFQSVSDAKEILTIESISVIGLLLGFIAYLIWQNQLLKKEGQDKDVKITEIIREHQKDLKEGNKDAVEMVNKYHTFVEQLSLLSHGRHR